MEEHYINWCLKRLTDIEAIIADMRSNLANLPAYEVSKDDKPNNLTERKDVASSPELLQFLSDYIEYTGNPDHAVVFRDFYQVFRDLMRADGYKVIPDIRATGVRLRKNGLSESMRKKRYPKGQNSKLCLIGYKWRKQ